MTFSYTSTVSLSGDWLLDLRHLFGVGCGVEGLGRELGALLRGAVLQFGTVLVDATLVIEPIGLFQLLLFVLGLLGLV